jgi:hypothetical protein
LFGAGFAPNTVRQILTYFMSKALGLSHILVYAAYVEISIHEVKFRDEQFHRLSALLCRIRTYVNARVH